MFQMQKIGRKISELRKKANMTQVELADRLGISFQAVSNWERGNSMPDISKLPELAEILDVSLDELLGEKSALVESVLHQNIEEVIASPQTSEEDVADILPILKPAQVSTIIRDVARTDFSKIHVFLPFMDEDDIKEFVLQAQQQGEKVDIFLPFMDEDDVKELALRAQQRGEKVDIFLPFMDEDDVKELALRAQERGEKVDIFLPFMDEDDVKELALRAQQRGEKVDVFLPFMDEDDVKELALRAQERGEKVDIFLPFMDEDDVKELALKVLKISIEKRS